MPDPTRPGGLAGPHSVESPYDDAAEDGGAERPAGTVAASLDTFTPPPALPKREPPAQTHWLQADELQRRIAVIRSLFSTEHAMAVLFDTTGVVLESLIASLQTSPLRFFGVMHAYFETTAGRFADVDDAVVTMIRGEPLRNKDMTTRAILSGNLVIVIDKNQWLAQGLGLADPQFAERQTAAREKLLKIDNQKFLEALRRGFNEIDRWLLALRAIGDDRWEVLKYLSDGLSSIRREMDIIRDLLGNSARIFSPKTASEQGVAFWELKAIGHYLANKMTILSGNYELARASPARVADYMSRIISYMKDYVSIRETNPFKFLPEIVDGLGGWKLTRPARKFLTENAPAWLYPIIENMIQNAMRDHLKKEGDFEGVIGLLSGEPLPASAPQGIKDEPSRWNVIFVKDNGTGIPDDIREKVFKERVRADTSAPGNGEGLLNSFQLLTRKGWHIWFDTIVEEGTTFYIGLPAWSAGGGTNGGEMGGNGTNGGALPAAGGAGGTGAGVTFNAIAGYEGDEEAGPPSAGARALLSAGQAGGAAIGVNAQAVSFIGARAVFTPAAVPAIP